MTLRRHQTRGMYDAKTRRCACCIVHTCGPLRPQDFALPSAQRGLRRLIMSSQCEILLARVALKRCQLRSTGKLDTVLRGSSTRATWHPLSSVAVLLHSDTSFLALLRSCFDWFRRFATCQQHSGRKAAVSQGYSREQGPPAKCDLAALLLTLSLLMK